MFMSAADALRRQCSTPIDKARIPMSISAISIRSSLAKAEAVKFAESQAEVASVYFGH